jgi:hypothetical protein
MHCIQGSDAHRLNLDPSDKRRLGVGDRVTEVKLPEPSFEALKELFLSNDFSRTRPFRPKQAPYDHVLAAQQQGTSIVQSFRKSMTRRGGNLYTVICDICAFANTNGGTIFVGVTDDSKLPVSGVTKPQEATKIIRNEVEKKITPPLDIQVDQQVTRGKKILQISVPVGEDPPYVIDENKIYVRDETDSNLAVRDEIVGLVKRSLKTTEPAADQTKASDKQSLPPKNGTMPEPKTGVEIVMTEVRKGTTYYSMKDLRNGDVVHNVTRKSARKLWQYAITEHETNAVDTDKVDWKGDIGLWKKYKRGSQTRFDLVQRGPNDNLHVYYGVTENGLHGPWQKLIDSLDGS